MKISDLQFTAEMKQNTWLGHSVEKPNDDAHRMVANERHAQEFVDSFGDVEIVWNERYKYWAVPEFADSRKRYSDIKQVHCDRYGCE